MILRVIMLVLMLALPACADPAAARFIEQEQAKGIPIVGFSGNVYNNDPKQIQYDEKGQVTEAQKQACESDAVFFTWRDLPEPDLNGFVRDCVMDPGLTPDHLQYVLYLAQPSLKDTERAALWTRIKSSFGGLDQQLDTIHGYANNRHVQLQ